MDETEPLHALRCVSARRSLKFPAGEHAQHFLLFDPSISKHDRMLLYMELFAHMRYFFDVEALPCFSPATYMPEQYVELRVLTDPRHPAYGQIGLFAKKTIPANTVVTPYSGYIEIFSTSCSSRTYTMGYGSLGDEYALDAEFAGNYGRFANDPRGVEGLAANLSAESRYTPRGEVYTALVSRRIINKGEEILMAYGKAHSLTPSPWVGLKGELLTRHRAGGIVPFPQFVEKSARDTESCPECTLVNKSLPVISLIERPDESQGNYPDGVTKLIGTRCRNCVHVENDRAEMVLLWECPQCGMWSLGSPTPAQIDHCFFCRSPRLPRARLVAVCCISSLAREDVLSSIMHGVRPAPSSLPTESSRDASSQAKTEKETTTIVLSSTDEASKESRNNNTISNGKEGNSGGNTQGWVEPFASEFVSWPLNVPFLSWQVWDAAIPISTIGKHSRFETHESIFLYAVNNADGSEDEHGILGEGKRVRDENEATQEEEEQQQQPTQRGRKPRIRRRKEELWQKKEPQPSDLQQHVNGESLSNLMFKAEGGRRSSFGSSSKDYLFYVSNSSTFGTEQYVNGNGNDTAAAFALQSLLNGVTRRVFAGKSYRSGAVVASVGGVILPAGDRRRRPDGSVLEIPMRHFVPARVRYRLRAMLRRGAALCNGEIDNDEAMTLCHLLQRLDKLSLVVTSELMFCPCLVLQAEEKEGNDDDKTDDAVGKEKNDLPQRHPLMEMCNVCFILTMDALGCPYVAAVAVRDISPFEPLLARIGS